jgi:uncharacterized protein (DUF1697 family)
MVNYAAFLRGINVGGRTAKKAQLTAAFESLGFEDVSTFRASGNVIFEAPGRAKPKGSEIEKALQSELGFEVAVFLRSADQLAKVADFEPFTAKQRKASTGKLQVAFLLKRPSKGKAKEALGLAGPKDPLAIEGTELFWLPAGNMRDSELNLRKLEALIGPWTMRTMGTTEQMAAKLSA